MLSYRPARSRLSRRFLRRLLQTVHVAVVRRGRSSKYPALKLLFLNAVTGTGVLPRVDGETVSQQTSQESPHSADGGLPASKRQQTANHITPPQRRAPRLPAQHPRPLRPDTIRRMTAPRLVIRRPRGMGRLFLLWGSWAKLAPDRILLASRAHLGRSLRPSRGSFREHPGCSLRVSRFPCLRGRGPPLKESRLACIPITALRLSPASTLRASPHAIDRHSYRNACADSCSSWQPHPAPAPDSSLSPPNTRPAGGHADLIQLEAAF